MYSQRPTLPSLRSLDLLPTKNSNEPSSYSCPKYAHQRQFSISSSTSSRTPSPPPTTSDKVSLVPCAMEDADAIVYVAPVPAGSKARPETLLLVGPALQQFRNPQRPVTKGARVHPYRMLRAPSSRRVSAAP